jgi:hypothetical protein
MKKRLCIKQIALTGVNMKICGNPDKKNKTQLTRKFIVTEIGLVVVFFFLILVELRKVLAGRNQEIGCSQIGFGAKFLEV